MAKRKLKIAIFHLGFFFSGGGEKLVLEEARGLAKKGHQVTLFAPVVDKKDCFPDLIQRVKVRSLFFPWTLKFPLRDFLAIAGSVFLTPLTFWRFTKFDIFLGANQPGPLICFFLSKILKKPYVIYLAQPTRLLYPRQVDLQEGFGKRAFDIFFWLTHYFRPLVAWLDRLSIRGANTILVNGDYMAGVISQVYGVRVVVCPAGCYPQKKIKQYRHRLRGKIRFRGKTFPKPFLLLTNRHYRQKRFDYAIRALGLIKKDFPQLSLVITGAASDYTVELKRLAAKLGLKERVKFVGLVSEKQLKNLYSQAIVYLYPSPEEDFGMGIIEAMAAGTPVVAWNRAGPTVTVKDGETGYLAKLGQLEDYSKKVRKLLQEPRLAAKFGRAGWQRSALFSYQNHLRILEGEIKKLL
ncbi:glycosyltransferase [Patescibacteria group bacterium]